MSEISTDGQEHEDYFDNVKGLLIFTVVLGHAFEYYTKTSGAMRFVHTIVYSFHMPLFIFISGYFSKNVDKARSKVLERLLIPYLIFDIFFSITQYYVTGENRINILIPTFAFWYLLALSWYRIFIKDLSRIRFIIPISFLISILSVHFSSISSYLALDRTLAFFPFFLLGFYCTRDRILYLRKIKSRYFVLLGLVVCTLVLMEQLYTNGITSVLLSQTMQLILAFIFGMIVLNVVSTKKNILTNVGRNSMIIFLGHGFINGLIRVVNPFVHNSFINFIFLLVFSVVVTLLLSTKIFEKTYDTMLNAICRVALINQKEDKRLSSSLTKSQ